MSNDGTFTSKVISAGTGKEHLDEIRLQITDTVTGKAAVISVLRKDFSWLMANPGKDIRGRTTFGQMPRVVK